MTNRLVPQASAFLVLRYGTIGVVAGFCSALFGIGGGFVVVPLLVVWLGLSPKLAAGTSLVAVGITAIFGVLAFQLVGAVEWKLAAIIGVPGAMGAFFGAWLQQRVASRTLVILLALFLDVVAVMLMLK